MVRFVIYNNINIITGRIEKYKRKVVEIQEFGGLFKSDGDFIDAISNNSDSRLDADSNKKSKKFL